MRELVEWAACRGRNARAFDVVRYQDASEALTTCQGCPVLELCGELVPGPGFEGVAGGTVYLNGHPVAVPMPHVPRVLPVREPEQRLQVAEAVTQVLAMAGDPAAIRRAHAAWVRGDRSAAARAGEIAYQRARHRLRKQRASA